MKEKINRNWKFYPGSGESAFSAAEFDDSSWRVLDLPHDWCVEGDFSPEHYQPRVFEENHLEFHSDSYLPRGCGWYRKTLEIPQIFSDQQIFLEFEGVFGESTVYADGIKIGENRSGYAGAVFDLTAAAAGKNSIEIAVKVSAERMQGWWYEGAGIYRHVHLIVKPAYAFEPWGVAVATPEITKSSAVVKITAELQSKKTFSAADGICAFRILDPDEKCVAETTVKIDSASLENGKIETALTVNDPVLWDVTSPNLYTLTAELSTSAGKDSAEIPFGIRYFEFTADDGFYLNGRKLQLRGGNIHHDFGGLGTALPDRAHWKNVEVLKEMGANMIRSAHNPAAPALMEVCDRLGMLLWAETRNLHTDDGAEADLTALIRRDRNHPSIILWGLANTAGARNGNDSLTVHLQKLHDLAHQLDPERLTAVALEGNADADANGFACVTDVVGYNGGGMAITDRDHRLFPDRKIMVSEFASGRGTRGIYENEPVEKDQEMEVLGDGRTFARNGKYSTEYNLVNTHEREWEYTDLRPYLAGGLMWSAIEYRGETCGWPVVTSQFGVLDICRFPKDCFYYYKKMWSAEPVLHVFPHWTHPGKEGENITLYAFTNCDFVELELNGKKIPGIPEFLQRGCSRPRIWWDVPYEPGTLIVIGKNNGQEVCRQVLRTAGAPSQLRLTPDRTALSADGEDISFIRIDVLDENGTVVPDAAIRLNFSVEGAGKLRGVCSGDPKSHESEQASFVRTFSGSALAIIQTLSGIEGEIRLTVQSDSASTAECILKSEKNSVQDLKRT